MLLFKDSRFLILLFDTIVSIIIYFAGKYMGAGQFEDIQFLIYALQPIFIAIIAGITTQKVLVARAKIKASSKSE